jgi:anti-sigma regulatory factor (Ser/Thr protein kinase)
VPSALDRASGIDEVAATLMRALAGLTGVLRVGFALSEGGGRRLRFTASDRSSAESVDWCHIDAYDDVPLTLVVRTGEAVVGSREELDRRFDRFVAAQPDDVQALAAVPLPGTGSPAGGFVVYLAERWRFDQAQRGLLETLAERAAEAVRRVRMGAGAPSEDEGWDEEGRDDEDATSGRLVLDDDPRSAGVARRFLCDFLQVAGLPDEVVGNAELCLSELVTNALLHAGGRTELRVTLDGSLVVSVRDHGAPTATENLDDPDPLRVHGRGLLLVEALADRWGTERDAAGRTVWFSLDLAHGG